MRDIYIINIGSSNESVEAYYDLIEQNKFCVNKRYLKSCNEMCANDVVCFKHRNKIIGVGIVEKIVNGETEEPVIKIHSEETYKKYPIVLLFSTIRECKEVLDVSDMNFGIGTIQKVKGDKYNNLLNLLFQYSCI